jgi:hypothetical protein
VAEEDADLRRAYAEIAADPLDEHLHEDVWARIASGDLGGDERARVFDHVAQCAACGEIYRGVATLRHEAPGFGVPVVARLRPGRSARAWQWVFAGAGLAAALVLVALWMRPVPATGPAGGGELRSGPSGSPVPLSPRGRIVAVSAVFRWEPVADARAYRVELLTPPSTVVWSSDELTTTEAHWPAGLRPAPGRSYWRVGAIPSWSRSTADVVWSPLVELELVP